MSTMGTSACVIHTRLILCMQGILCKGSASRSVGSTSDGWAQTQTDRNGRNGKKPDTHLLRDEPKKHLFECGV